MQAKLVIDGKEFPIEILDPALQEIIKPKTAHHTVYERVDWSKKYYYTDGVGNSTKGDDYGQIIDNNRYSNANYYSDPEISANNARADKLMRQLRRFAVEHRKNNIDLTSCDQKYVICYDQSEKHFDINFTRNGSVFGVIYFDTKDTARRAIDEFRDELIWYFTEYKDSL